MDCALRLKMIEEYVSPKLTEIIRAATFDYLIICLKNVRKKEKKRPSLQPRLKNLNCSCRANIPQPKHIQIAIIENYETNKYLHTYLLIWWNHSLFAIFPLKCGCAKKDYFLDLSLGQLNRKHWILMSKCAGLIGSC